MSKAILVMDMPKSCRDCSIMFTDIHSDYCPRNGQDVFDYVDNDTKPDWCPLKYVPKKQPHYSIDETFMRGAKTGYNACIDDILKGSEENG